MTEEQIAKVEEWKKEYPHIYKSTISGEDYIYRTLTRDDYIQLTIKQAMNPQTFDHDMEVFQTCVLSEFDVKELINRGGVVTVISEKIMLKSGFEAVESEEL